MEMVMKMPDNFVEVCEDEMMYVEGGETVRVYVKGSFFRTVIEGGTTAVCGAIGNIAGIPGAAAGAFIGSMIGGWYADNATGHLNMNSYYYVGKVYIPYRKTSIFIH